MGKGIYTLETSGLLVTLNEQTGLPIEYRRDKFPFGTQEEGQKITARFCRLHPRAYFDVEAVPYGSHVGRVCAEFFFRVAEDETEAAVFTLRYRIDRSALVITLEDVEEREGYELISLTIPRLVQISTADDAEAWLAHAKASGSFVYLKDAIPCKMLEHEYFGNIMPILPLVMLGDRNTVCTLEVTAFQDGTLLEVEESPRGKRAFLGTIKQYRVDGSSWCNSNDDNLTKVYGNEDTINLPIEQKSSCRLDFLGDYDGNGRVDWLDGAKAVHARMPKLRTDFYDDKFMYVLPGDHPKLEKPKNTFREAYDYIRQLSMWTDGCQQVTFITGWQVEGMDTGYPDVTQINERMGGYEDYMELRRKAEDLGCFLGLHDNFDDAYPSSIAWDEDMIARLPDGSLWSSRNWTRDMSYVQGLAKYMKKYGKARIRTACSRYKIREVAHLDVLSWFAIRNDWDPNYPASGIRNLYEGRYRILEEYAKHGADVMSESLRYPMIGRMNLNFVENEFFRPCPFGGEEIPLISLVYRNAAIYGGDELRGPGDWARRLIHNIHKIVWFFWPKPVEEEIPELKEIYYLLYLPWFLLHKLEIVDYQSSGDEVYLMLEEDSSIRSNTKTGEYSVVWRGREISRNESVFCPVNEKKIAFFSKRDGELSYPLSKARCGSRPKVYEITEDGPKDCGGYVLEDGCLKVRVKAGYPVIVKFED